MELIGYSRGLYSNWFFYKPFRVLFDCGEGCALTMRNHVFAVEKIFLSHSHGDHIYGLPAFLDARGSARGSKDKPLEIYFPVSMNMKMSALRDFCGNRKRSFKIDWLPITHQMWVELTKGIYIKSFLMDHCGKYNTLGYKIVQKRNRLKEKYKNKNIPELLKKDFSKEDITEEYDGIILAYCLDSFSFDFYEIENANIAILDSTFLKKEDRNENTHMTYDECMSLANVANIKYPVLAHISGRYSKKEISEVVRCSSAILIDNSKKFSLNF